MIRSYAPALSPLMLACVVVLVGCAAQGAFKEGRTLASEGKNLEALAKFEKASQLDGRSIEYRIAVIQAREKIVTDLLKAAEQASNQNLHEEAKQLYNRVLTLQPTNGRANEGLQAIEANARHIKWLEQAETAFSKKDSKTGLTWARMVIAENPRNKKAFRIIQSKPELALDRSITIANTTLPDVYRKPITIEFKDAPIKTVFEVISRTSGLNFLFDKDVRTEQKTSIFLKNSTIEAAINLTLLTNQLEQRTLDGNTMLIYPNTQAKQREYQPLTVKTFYLINAEAKNVANSLKTILKSRDIVVDDKLNMLILRDSPQAIALAEKLVALHDIAEPEVMLEVEILEVKRTRLMDLGIRWPDQLSLSPLGDGLTLADIRKLNSNSIGVLVAPATVSAKNVDTDANILANPRIRTRNREKAKILIGERVPNITSTSTSTGFVSESVNYVDVGLKLDVEPTIYADGEVAIKIALEVSNIINQLQTKSGSIAYQIGTRSAQTVLRLKDGENQVLAGLINDEDRRTGNKIPALGDIPIIGRLFGNQVDDNSKTEIILSITPRILRNVERPSIDILEFDSGTETNLGSRVVRSVGVETGSTSQLSSNTTAVPQGAMSASQIPSANQTTTAPSSPSGSSSPPPPVVQGAPPIGEASMQLRWQGPTAMHVGDTFAVQLLMQAEQPVVSIPLAVGFDPRVLQVISVAEGEFLRQNGGQTNFTTRVDPNGQILLTGTRAGESGATALGSLVTISLRVISAATAETRIQLLTIAPIALGGRSVATVLPLPHIIKIMP